MHQLLPTSLTHQASMWPFTNLFGAAATEAAEDIYENEYDSETADLPTAVDEDSEDVYNNDYDNELGQFSEDPVEEIFDDFNEMVPIETASIGSTLTLEGEAVDGEIGEAILRETNLASSKGMLEEVFDDKTGAPDRSNAAPILSPVRSKRSASPETEAWEDHPPSLVAGRQRHETLLTSTPGRHSWEARDHQTWLNHFNDSLLQYFKEEFRSLADADWAPWRSYRLISNLALENWNGVRSLDQSDVIELKQVIHDLAFGDRAHEVVELFEEWAEKSEKYADSLWSHDEQLFSTYSGLFHMHYHAGFNFLLMIQTFYNIRDRTGYNGQELWKEFSDYLDELDPSHQVKAFIPELAKVIPFPNPPVASRNQVSVSIDSGIVNPNRMKEIKLNFAYVFLQLWEHGWSLVESWKWMSSVYDSAPVGTDFIDYEIPKIMSTSSKADILATHARDYGQRLLQRVQMTIRPKHVSKQLVAMYQARLAEGYDIKYLNEVLCKSAEGQIDPEIVLSTFSRLNDDSLTPERALLASSRDLQSLWDQYHRDKYEAQHSQSEINKSIHDSYIVEPADHGVFGLKVEGGKDHLDFDDVLAEMDFEEVTPNRPSTRFDPTDDVLFEIPITIRTTATTRDAATSPRGPTGPSTTFRDAPTSPRPRTPTTPKASDIALPTSDFGRHFNNLRPRKHHAREPKVKKVDPLRYTNRLIEPRRLPNTPTRSHLPPSPRRKGAKARKCHTCGRAFRVKRATRKVQKKAESPRRSTRQRTVAVKYTR